jgi:hypothetical protein
LLEGSNPLRTCPYCSEAIQDDVVACPICKTTIVAGAYPGGVPQTTPAAPTQPYPAANAYPTAPPQTSGKATASLIAGIAGYVILPLLAAIPAIVLGHLALSEIKKSAGRLKGEGMAIAGLVLGYVQLAGIPFILIIAAIAIPNLIRARMAANEASAVGTLRVYTTASISYAVQCPKIGFARAVTNLGPGSGDCDHANLVDGVLGASSPTKNGYRFEYAPSAPDDNGLITHFAFTADPISNGTGTRHFFVDDTGVIRYNAAGPADVESPVLQ